MRIAQVAPLFESVPPRLYGGTERVVSWLTEELVRQGHNVTLFASGDSDTAARLVSPRDRGLRLDPTVVDSTVHHVLMLEQVLQRGREFDIVHLHIDYLHYPTARRLGVPTVTTLHGRLDLPDLNGIFKEFSELPVVSISDAQRDPVPWLNYQATVHHGLPADRLIASERSDGYLAFLGRIAYDKGVDQAIAIARGAGMPLRIAAKIDAVDREYFEERLVPMLREPGVEFLGEIREEEKQAFLGGAGALLFPIRWPEPFGIVLIEAMACGTPVLAFPCGSVPEIVEEGLTGVVVASVPEALENLSRALALDRHAIRRRFEERFTAERMTQEYVRVYESLVGADRVLSAGASWAT